MFANWISLFANRSSRSNYAMLQSALIAEIGWPRRSDVHPSSLP
jgi:hypothetical protein